jgi:hypothetical protein
MFKIFALTMVGIYTYYDFQTDKGQHVRAKFVNGVWLVLVTLLYSDSFKVIGWIFRKYDRTKELWSVPVGFIPGRVHFLINIIHTVSAICLIYFSYSTIKRKESGRIWTIRILPFLAATEVFAFYRGWLGSGNDSTINQISALIIGSVFSGGICITFILIYQSRFMLDFFQRRNADSENSEISDDSRTLD